MVDRRRIQGATATPRRKTTCSAAVGEANPRHRNALLADIVAVDGKQEGGVSDALEGDAVRGAETDGGASARDAEVRRWVRSASRRRA